MLVLNLARCFEYILKIYKSTFFTRKEGLYYCFHPLMEESETKWQMARQMCTLIETVFEYHEQLLEWRSQLLFLLKLRLQFLQWKLVYSAECCSRWCLSNSFFWPNSVLHCIQLNLTPSCFFWWILRSLPLLNFASQMTQQNNLSSEWIIEWIFKALARINVFRQILHIYSWALFMWTL